MPSPFADTSPKPEKPGEYLIHYVLVAPSFKSSERHEFVPPICTSTLGINSPDPLIRKGLEMSYRWMTNGGSL